MRHFSFLYLTEEAYLKQREPITTLRNPSCIKYLLQKLSYLSQGNNVVYVAASHMDGFLWGATCISSTQLNRPFQNKMSICQPRKL
jgi:hypothetical protein